MDVGGGSTWSISSLDSGPQAGTPRDVLTRSSIARSLFLVGSCSICVLEPGSCRVFLWLLRIGDSSRRPEINSIGLRFVVTAAPPPAPSGARRCLIACCMRFKKAGAAPSSSISRTSLTFPGSAVFGRVPDSSGYGPDKITGSELWSISSAMLPTGDSPGEMYMPQSEGLLEAEGTRACSLASLVVSREESPTSYPTGDFSRPPEDGPTDLARTRFPPESETLRNERVAASVVTIPCALPLRMSSKPPKPSRGAAGCGGLLLSTVTSVSFLSHASMRRDAEGMRSRMMSHLIGVSVQDEKRVNM